MIIDIPFIGVIGNLLSPDRHGVSGQIISASGVSYALRQGEIECRKFSCNGLAVAAAADGNADRHGSCARSPVMLKGILTISPGDTVPYDPLRETELISVSVKLN